MMKTIRVERLIEKSIAWGAQNDYKTEFYTLEIEKKINCETFYWFKDTILFRTSVVAYLVKYINHNILKLKLSPTSTNLT